MTSVTLSIDEKVLQAARVRAVREGTSVNEICRRAIESYARAPSGDRLRRFDSLMDKIDSRAGKAQPLPAPWKSRDEMYEDAISQRQPVATPKRRGGGG